SAHAAKPAAAFTISRAAAATVERRGASTPCDAGSALISVVKGIESRLALFLRLASANGDRPPDDCFSNCIDLSRKPLARETLPCACCRTIPALQIKATVVTRRAAFLVPVRQAIIRVLRPAAQTRS